MRLRAIRFILIVSLLALGSSCRRGTSATAPASAAYSDGFEVVVFDVKDGTPVNVRSLRLKEAEQAIAAGAQAWVPGDGTAVQRQLSTGKKGDSNVVVSVGSLDGGRQQIRVAFHESNRTFVYEYRVEGSNVRPVRSEYYDLARSNVTQYSGK